jgi:hypothetical protein
MYRSRQMIVQGSLQITIAKGVKHNNTPFLSRHSTSARNTLALRISSFVKLPQTFEALLLPQSNAVKLTRRRVFIVSLLPLSLPSFQLDSIIDRIPAGIGQEVSRLRTDITDGQPHTWIANIDHSTAYPIRWRGTTSLLCVYIDTALCDTTLVKLVSWTSGATEDDE